MIRRDLVRKFPTSSSRVGTSPSQFQMKLRTVIINNAEFVDTRFQYTDRILNPKIFFLYKTST